MAQYITDDPFMEAKALREQLAALRDWAKGMVTADGHTTAMLKRTSKKKYRR
jgi:hypothetical protein